MQATAAPVIVIAVGITAAVFVLLARGLVESIRESGHARLIVGGLVALLGAIVVLTYLGVELPREGG
jgi:FtsH-binding integral membrane protein